MCVSLFLLFCCSSVLHVYVNLFLFVLRQALEDQFQQELEEQQSFYADVTGEGGIPPLHSILSGTVRSKVGRDGTVSSRRSTVL